MSGRRKEEEAWETVTYAMPGMEEGSASPAA